MTQPTWEGTLEVRAAPAGLQLVGSFPYDSPSMLVHKGRMIRELVRPGAFEFARDVHLLAQHDRTRPLASLRAGSLELKDGPQALAFVAQLPPEEAQPTWMTDAVRGVRAGLLLGVSPEWFVKPGGEAIRREPGRLPAREIRAAVLTELSIVTRGVYDESSVESRAAERVLVDAEESLRWL